MISFWGLVAVSTGLSSLAFESFGLGPTLKISSPFFLKISTSELSDDWESDDATSRQAHLCSESPVVHTLTSM